MSTDGTAPVEVVREDSASRYEIRLGGERVGFAAYRLEPGAVVFTHTEINPDRSGQGLASRLARGALDDVVGRGLRIIPLCPFIAGYVDRHPQYAAHV